MKLNQVDFCAAGIKEMKGKYLENATRNSPQDLFVNTFAVNSLYLNFKLKKNIICKMR